MNFYRADLLRKSQQLRKNMTPQEKHLWYDYLRDYIPHFYRQKPISCYILDFYCPKAKLAIELDGSQHYEEDSLKYDRKRENELEKLGIVVVRYTNRQIDSDFIGVCADIDKMIKV